MWSLSGSLSLGMGDCDKLLAIIVGCNHFTIPGIICLQDSVPSVMVSGVDGAHGVLDANGLSVP